MTPKKIVSAAALSLLFAAGAVSAQSTTTPGTPNTGQGGDFTSNAIILATTGAIAVAGVAYLSRRTRNV